MRKYWAIFKASWQNNVEYRADFLAHMILGLISLAVTAFIFKAVFNQTVNFGGYTFSSMFTYLVMTKVLHFTTRGNTARYIADEIKEGKLSLYLIKPIDYLKNWASLFLADRFFEVSVRFSLIIVFFLFLPKYFSFPSVVTFMLFIFSLIMALFLNYLINILTASCSFWVTDIRLFSTALNLATGFFAGELVPLDIFPPVLRKVSLFLPFQYTLFFPIKIYQGALTGGEIVWGFLSAVFWIIILIGLQKYLWSKGLKNYEAIGQ